MTNLQKFINSLSEPDYSPNRKVHYKLNNYLKTGIDFISSAKVGHKKPPRILKAEYYYNRGVAHLRKGQNDQAISDFSMAILLNPKFVMAYNNRGLAYGRDKGRYDKAISDFNKAIELNPRNVEAYNYRAVAYYFKDQYDKAISDFNKAIELYPSYALAYANRGETCFSKKEYNKAWNDINKAQALGEQVNPKFLKELREALGRER